MKGRSILWCVGVAAVLVTSVGCGRVNPARRGLWSAVEAKRAELNQCYEQAVTRDASTAGSMVLWLEVDDESGSVNNVEVENSDVADPSLEPCVTGALRSIRLSEAPPITMRVQYTFLFRTAGPDQPPPPAVEGGAPPPPPAVQGGAPPPPPAVPAGSQPPPPARGM